MDALEERREEIRAALKEVYESYQEKGLLSIFLWGSILSDEYDSEVSDVDAVGIVDHRAREEDALAIRNFLREHYPHIIKFHLNFVYLDEFHDGTVRSRLTGYIDPRLLLLDFPYWECVAGKHFVRSDFALPDISYDEAVQIIIANTRTRYLPGYESGEMEQIPYICKRLFRICYNLSKKEGASYLFTYAGVMQHVPAFARPVAKKLWELKQVQWDPVLFARYYNDFLAFLDSLEE